MKYFFFLLAFMYTHSSYGQGQVILDITNSSCDGCCDGSVDVTAIGCTGAYTFDWTGSDGFAADSEDIDNICAGSYILCITDELGFVACPAFIIEDTSGDTTLVELWDCGFEPPVITVCPSDTTANVNASCEIMVGDYTGLVVATDDSTAVDDLIITQSPAAGTSLIGTQFITINVQDAEGNSSTCWFQLTALDSTAPVITQCANDVTVEVNSGGEYVMEDFTAEVIANDNCTAASIVSISQYPQAESIISAVAEPVTVTLIATDANGLSDSCEFQLTVGAGCIDPLACNYLPSAAIDNGSCCYTSCGCTAPSAENYDPAAQCEDFSCLYLVSGLVFHDVNENGLFDGSDYGLAGEVVTLEPLGIMAITNEDGVYQFPSVGAGNYTMTVTGNPVFPFHITDQSVPITISSGDSSSVDFGLSNEAPIFDVDITFYPPSQGYACDVHRYHYIYFKNLGNVPIDGVIEFQFDSLFQGYSEASPIDSASTHTLWLSFEDLLPSSQECYRVVLHTPTVDHIGEFLSSSATIWGFHGTDTVAFGQQNLEVELTCAYDPNDKQVFPRGYSEMHYISNDTVLEYLVRFQNTGNAPATDVRILDTLDVGLDLHSFQLVANSHSVVTTIDPESREVAFYFENIMLPDSVNNEPESHGLVSFKIRPESGLPLLTELNNRANIFFDNNPPIVTNTTWSTIYDCSLFETEFTQNGAVLTASEGDSYQWYLNDEIIDGADSQDYEATVSGFYSVAIESEFPCSDVSSSEYVLINSLDEFNSLPVLLFPNPMRNSTTIILEDTKGYTHLELFDIQGRLVRQESLRLVNSRMEFERGSLNKGQYVLRLVGSRGNIEIPILIE